MSKKQSTNLSGAKKSKALPKPLQTYDFPIIGIGASAGGLEALELFFGAIEKDPGMAYVVIQHLDPDYVGIMPEILQRGTTLKVIQVKDRELVKPNFIYVIPPNKSMSILNGKLHLFDPVESRGLRLPIDIFFRSMSADRQEKSIGIVLSGMGSDGSLGLRSIKEKHGIVLVQDPATAKFDGMPKAAIQSVMVDIIAPPQELPLKLSAFLNHKHDPVKEGGTKKISITSLEKIILLIRDNTGNDFSLYKKNTLIRRIERRMRIHLIDNISSYVRFLQENLTEIEILSKEMLIGVTSFFRDPSMWDALLTNYLPQLIAKCPDNHVIKAWVPACSSGEEAYSLAIIIKEAIDNLPSSRGITVQVFATDIDADTIERARKGVFRKNSSVDISPKRFKRFFKLEGDDFIRIIPKVREMVVFAPQNIIKDPPFTKLDILCCRNMMIYMEPPLQSRLISLFHYSLNPEGLLVLGSAESPGSNGDGFITLDPKQKIYRRVPTKEVRMMVDFPSAFKLTRSDSSGSKIISRKPETFQSDLEQVILHGFSPPTILVNSEGDILYITGKTGTYLEPTSGKANWNIFVMAKDGLREHLPSAFRRTILTGEKVFLENIRISRPDSRTLVSVVIQKLQKPDSLNGLIILVFSDTDDPDLLKSNSKKSGKGVANDNVKKLEAELARALDDLQITREEMQTSQEELKSTNEELQSTNEELQSTNEELTTSKEEMQSLNEELQTVNLELQTKIADYLRTSDDMKNLLNSTEIATLFLDREMNVRRYTEQVTRIFKLRPGDIGRPFTDLANTLKYPELDTNAKEVLRTLITVETAIATDSDKWFSVRIMPYRTIDDRIDGVVITFSDITGAKKVEAELNETRAKLKAKG